MKFAVVPWAEQELDDKLFYEIEIDGQRRPKASSIYQMYEEFCRLGHEIHTCDYYQNWEEVDYFLLFPIDWIMADRITEAGYADRIIYCNAEPPSVCELHTEEGYQILKQIFPRIMTWNPEWVDGVQIFKRCIPYHYQLYPCDIPFSKRKLITGISANKHSKYPDELYSVRERAYDYFEAHYPGQFDFYGTGWEGTDHPCYRGTVESKAETFHNYRFALCFENTRMKKDYITEKIWDCLCAQIVPVYLGAENIRDYIPENCFIDYSEFSSDEELATYLLDMNETSYQSYLDAATRLLNTDVRHQFSGELYAHDILNAVATSNGFQMTEYGRRFLRNKAAREMRNQKLMILRSHLKRLLIKRR